MSNQYSKPWTVAESKLLWENPDMTYKQLAEMLPGRTPEAVRQFAERVGAYRSHRGRPSGRGKMLTVYDKFSERVICRKGTAQNIAFLLGITPQMVNYLYRKCRSGGNTRRYVITDYRGG